jgi:hypothetical protein
MPSRHPNNDGLLALTKLEQLKLVRAIEPGLKALIRRDEGTLLLRLCAAEALVGAISVSADVRPDELIGPLVSLIEGSARELRVLDSLDSAVPELIITYRGRIWEWKVSSLEDLVNELNRLFQEDPRARAVAVLGEWDDMLQLWCVPKEALSLLLRENFFRPQNRAELSTILGQGLS